MNNLKIDLPVIMSFTALVMFVAILFFGGSQVNASPSSYLRSDPVGAATGSATTSPKFMTAGTATTTVSFDTAKGNNFSVQQMILALSLRSSTSVTTLFGTSTFAVTIEQSDDCINWSSATSSTIQTSSTELSGNVLLASTTNATRFITVPPPILRCVRALVGINPGSSGNGAAWGQFIGIKEQQ